MSATSLARVLARSRRPRHHIALLGATAVLAVSGALAAPLAAQADGAVAATSSQEGASSHQGTSATAGEKHHKKHHGKHGHKHGHGHKGKHKPKHRHHKKHPPIPTAGGPSAVFGAGSEWKRDISTAPVAANSPGIVSNLNQQVTGYFNGVASFNYNRFDVSFATADPQTPLTTVHWDNCSGFSWVPSELFDPAHGAVFVDVPIPDTAVPAPGTDGELSVWNPSTDQLWEFWQAQHEADGWHACWGGRIDQASTSPGYFQNGTTGVTASGLAAAGGAIAINEAQLGTITHAMSLNVINAANWQEVSYPAQRSDGGDAAGTPDAIREGQRFRLDPSVNVAKLHLSPVATMIATAAQRYGFIVVDRAGAVGINAEDGTMAQNATGTDPWDALLDGDVSYNVLAGFPWSKMQAMPVDYGKP